MNTRWRILLICVYRTSAGGAMKRCDYVSPPVWQMMHSFASPLQLRVFILAQQVCVCSHARTFMMQFLRCICMRACVCVCVCVCACDAADVQATAGVLVVWVHYSGSLGRCSLWHHLSGLSFFSPSCTLTTLMVLTWENQNPAIHWNFFSLFFFFFMHSRSPRCRRRGTFAKQSQKDCSRNWATK